MVRTLRMLSVRMAHQWALPLHQCLASVAGMSQECLWPYRHTDGARSP